MPICVRDKETKEVLGVYGSFEEIDKLYGPRTCYIDNVTMEDRMPKSSQREIDYWHEKMGMIRRYGAIPIVDLLGLISDEERVLFDRFCMGKTMAVTSRGEVLMYGHDVEKYMGWREAPTY